jgi:SAM-dependent methyltransferase
MTNVFHHLHSPPLFLAEAERCVRPGGRLVMIEPWVTPWSRIIYHYLHHEFFGPEVEAWEIAEGGPLSGANGALPWIVFNRDGQRFKREFPNWDLSVTPWMPFRYLVSGGVSMRPLMPGWTYGLWSAAEGVLRPWVRDMAMFAIIVLTHRNE